MKKILSVLLLIIVSNAYGQQINMWMKQLESSNDSSKELKAENVIIKYLKYDISTLLLPKSEFLGYIGTDYERIKIYYDSISKDNKKPEIYNVKVNHWWERIDAILKEGLSLNNSENIKIYVSGAMMNIKTQDLRLKVF